MGEIYSHTPENQINEPSIKKNNDGAFSNYPEDTNNQITDIENSIQKSKAYGVLNALDSQ